MHLPEALKRLNQVSTRISVSYKQRYSRYASKADANTTGFQGMPPQLIQPCLINALSANRPIKRAIDLGCGNGAFALMAATLGWNAYGIDAAADLVEEACQLRDDLRKGGLIDADIVCEFAVGSIYPADWQQSYESFVVEQAKNEFTMPVGMPTNAYEQLGISLSEMDLIYAFTWSDQMPFLCRFLDASASPEAVFLLPHYRGVEGRFDEDLKLESLTERVPSALFTGVRKGVSAEVRAD